MSNLLFRFLNYIEEKNLFSKNDSLLIAVSGGLDSVALCELCQQAGFDYVMAHGNFNLRGAESDRDEQFVLGLAKKYAREVFTMSFDTEKYAAEQKCSIQVAARNLRYQWFRQFLQQTDPISGQLPSRNLPTVKYILTAHHLDDNIETLLMNFFKGTGMAGLHGILAKQGDIVRPLLFACKDELKEFAVEEKLNWIEDSSNESIKYTRNHLRKKLLPIIFEIFPEAKANLGNDLIRFGEIETLYKEAVKAHKKFLIEKKGDEFHIPVLKLKKSEPLHTLVFEIFRDYGFFSSQVDGLIRLLESESGKCMLSASHRVLKHRQWLIISPLQSPEQSHSLIAEETKTIRVPAFELRLAQADAKGYEIAGKPGLAEIDAEAIHYPLLLRKWKAGDYFYPLGMRKKKKVSRFLIDQKIPKNGKENVWVIEMDKKIVWVVGMRIDDRFSIKPGTRRILKIEMRVP